MIGIIPSPFTFLQKDIIQQKISCGTFCRYHSPFIWICLSPGCLFIGCGRDQRGHSISHAVKTKHPCVMNLSTRTLWCYECDREVLIDLQPEASRAQLRQLQTLFQGSPLPLGTPFPSSGTPLGPTSAIPPAGTPSTLSSASSSGTLPAGTSAPLLASSPVPGAIATAVGSVQYPAASPTSGRLCGLHNMSNTCYMNAALQALSMCYPLQRHFARSTRYMALAEAYQELVHHMWKGNASSIWPDHFRTMVAFRNSMFAGAEQHDSQELLHFVLDFIDEELASDLHLVAPTAPRRPGWSPCPCPAQRLRMPLSTGGRGPSTGPNPPATLVDLT
ncbi:putative ubiquitin carboxyl-terminal hydrolase 33 [Paratrimastix pyriformis]|uniref:Ubiquitin carboxyl-terminal hydrolase 33 n=1 Tax=Paratrimastix pyriformis TaxID=342808 RepID=A0ABQ8UMU7_9EUKA|nr:putative ubiquitin carboxyl-terminal hydrolase 33 [Paratrimastix pyriformis]